MSYALLDVVFDADHSSLVCSHSQLTSDPLLSTLNTVSCNSDLVCGVVLTLTLCVDDTSTGFVNAYLSDLEVSYALLDDVFKADNYFVWSPSQFLLTSDPSLSCWIR